MNSIRIYPFLIMFVSSLLFVPFGINHVHAAASAGTPTPDPLGEKQLSADTVKIEIRGNNEFVSQTRSAFNMLAQCDLDAFRKVDEFMAKIQEYNRSGMEIVSDTFLASNTTAFAPGYSREAQVFWYAGTMVHDAHHNWQSAQGMNTDWGSLSLEQREELETEARKVQIDTLQRCLPSIKESARSEAQAMIDYLVGMQDGTQECAYCKVEWGDRSW